MKIDDVKTLKFEAEIALIVETVDRMVKERLAPVLKELEATKAELVNVKRERDLLFTQRWAAPE